MENKTDYKYMQKNDLIKAINTDEIVKGVVILEKTNEGILVFDTLDEKEIFYSYPQKINLKRISEKIIISNKLVLTNQLSSEDIARKLLKVLSKDYFTILNKIYIINNMYDFNKIVKNEKINDPNKSYFHDFYSKNMGINILENNCIIINYRLIKKICYENLRSLNISIKDNIDEKLNIYFYTILLHELRYLLLNTHDYIPEDIYPIDDVIEDKLEEFGNITYEENKNIFLMKGKNKNGIKFKQ